MPWKHLKDGLQKMGEKIEKRVEQVVEQAESQLEKGTQQMKNTLTQTKTTLSQVSDTVVHQVQEGADTVKAKVNHIGQMGQETTQVLKASTESVVESIQVQASKVGETLQEGVVRTHHGIQQATHTVNTSVADTLDHFVGEHAQPLSTFIREDGVQTVAGLAFTPIYFAQRGKIGYDAYRAFDQGEIPLGELVLRILSPSAHTAQSFLKDPGNQEMIAQFISKVIPESIQTEYIDAVKEAGEKVGDIIPDTPQERIKALLSYRKPSQNEEEVSNEEDSNEEVSNGEFSNGEASDP